MRPIPGPEPLPRAIKRYFSDNAGSARISVIGQLVSAASLGVFAVSVVELAGRSGRGSAALQAAGGAGGALTVATLGTSALTSLRLAQGRAEDPDTAVRLHRRVFLVGGPLHGPAIGLLTGALGLAGRRRNEQPRWVVDREPRRGGRRPARPVVDQDEVDGVADSCQPVDRTAARRDRRNHAASGAPVTDLHLLEIPRSASA